MYRLLSCMLRAWLCLFLCHVTVEAAVDYSDIDITVSTLDDLETVLEDTVPKLSVKSLCDKNYLSCHLRCDKGLGVKAPPPRGNRLMAMPHPVCYCDGLCLAYQDCCHDYHEVCPHLVREFLHSTFRRAEAECIGKYAFLALKDGRRSARETPPESITTSPGFTLGDVVKSLDAGNVPVTDTETGLQYKSARDFAVLNPYMAEAEAKTRLAPWTPKLMFPGPQKIGDLVALLQNVSMVLPDHAILAFELFGTFVRLRECPQQTILTCPHLGGDSEQTENKEQSTRIRLVNTTLACQFLSPAPDVEQTTMIRVNADKLTFPPVFYIKNLKSNGVGNAKPPPVLSTTIGQMDSMSSPVANFTVAKPNPFQPKPVTRSPVLCLNTFVNSLSIAETPLNFTVIVDGRTPDDGELRLRPEKKSANWKSIQCAKGSRFQSEKDIGESNSCVPIVVCKKGLVYANGACRRPSMMTLHVKTAGEDLNERTSANVTKAMAKLFDQVLGDPNRTDFVVHQHPSSCLSTLNLGNTSYIEQSYYGLYHVFFYRLPVSTR